MDHAPAIDEVELRILQLLFEGLGEAAVGRRLGLGHRTVQRRMRNLMIRWRVKGRVALGARAQELGLLVTDSGSAKAA
ncbi:LuxR C-terminal-related transcriptional regulator [Streptomyces sp. NPDC050997]|uniref:LuxR C-terminal-related transcriptional regulator n=1 Tax=Streptomyces sp. NPDC050997 TaxID=3155519 RepID=UPI00343ABB5D